MANAPAIVPTMRGTQLSFPMARHPERPASIEPKGVVYTKRWVVDLLLDLAGYVGDEDLANRVAIEPAAGDGAFLCAMIERLLDACERMGCSIADCTGAIVAFEVDEASAMRARAVAKQVLLDRGVAPWIAKSLTDAWIRTGDYLLDSMSLLADYVIGNPPYVRLEEIPEDTASLYRRTYATMRGRADLYVAFFEAALRQLRPSGACAFICADRWMRNQYGSQLRELITSEFSVEAVIDMNTANAFDDEVDAYPAVTVIRRRAQGRTLVARVGPEAEEMGPGSLSDYLTTDAGEATARERPPGVRVAIVDEWFRNSEPWCCQSPEKLALLRRLEGTFSPLEAHARIGIGVATGLDGVFITKDANLVEPSRLLKLATARDIRGGELQWSGNYLVDPWERDGLVDLNKYPRLRHYFSEHEFALKKRHTAIKSKNSWFKTIDRVNHELIDKRKLYIADIRNVLDPSLDAGGTYPHHNLYFVQSDVWDLEVLGGLLISAIGQFFVESYGVRMRGGYLRFQAQYLRRIRVPRPDRVSAAQRSFLIQAFRSKDRRLATEVAVSLYGIGKREMETAFGHR